ncbi:MAG: helix-turn-helix domain-containing protein [Rikenellaceae bacterium]|jgi:excisionase family DNA binding protein|nr:helix-turn-helix domain-containing protein [Rikenellaceae bacterium]
MSNQIITKDSTRIVGFFKSIERMLDGIERLVANHKPHLNGERFLTDREVSERLKLSRRTLQDYRTEGKIPYIHLGGKILYQESDVQKLLETNYYKSFE